MIATNIIKVRGGSKVVCEDGVQAVTDCLQVVRQLLINPRVVLTLCRADHSHYWRCLVADALRRWQQLRYSSTCLQLWTFLCMFRTVVV